MAVQCSNEITGTVAILLTLLQDQANQLAAIRKELRAIQSELSGTSKTPAGYVEPKILAAKKFVSVKQAAFLLNTSEKTVRRLIERKILRTSNGLRVKQIPIEDIHAYMKRTE